MRGLLLLALPACAMAGVDNAAVAAAEAGSAGSMPALAGALGLFGAAWLGWAGREDGNALTGAAVGFGIGAAIGLIVSAVL